MNLYFNIIFGIFILIVAGILVYRYVFSKFQHQRAVEFFKANRIQDALNIFKKLKEAENKNPVYKWYLVQIFERTHNIDAAIAELRAIIADGIFTDECPEIEVLKKFADMYVTKGLLIDAETVLHTIASRLPQYLDGFMKLAHAYYKNGNYERSIAIYQTLLKKGSKSHEVQKFLALAYYYNEQKKEAFSACKEYIDLDYPFDYEISYLYALMLEESAHFDLAIEFFKYCLPDTMYGPGANMHIGNCLCSQKKNDEGVAYYEKALGNENLPEDDRLAVLYALAEIELAEDDIEKAWMHWEIITSIRSDYRDVAQKMEKYAYFNEHVAIRNLYALSQKDFESSLRGVIAYLGYIIDKEILVSSKDLLRYQATYKDHSGFQKAIVEIAKWKNPAGELQIQELILLLKESRAKKAVFITLSDFSDSCYVLAEQYPIDLINGTALEALLKQNS